MTSVTQYWLPLAAMLVFAGAASAQENPSEQTRGAETQVLSAEDLDVLAGGTGVTAIALTEQTLNAVNAGNSVNAEVVNSGHVNIGSNAFSGYSGVGNFVFNTGHNNNLQSTMSLSIILAPPEPGS